MDDITVNVSEIYRKCKSVFEQSSPIVSKFLYKIANYSILGFQFKLLMIHSNYLYIIMFCEISYRLLPHRLLRINDLLDRISIVLTWTFLFYLAFYRSELINIIGRIL